MAERRAEVVEVGPDTVHLRWRGACSECGGCGGRCQLFAGANDGRIDVPRSSPMALSVGQEVTLELPDSQLRQQALVGYGLPLLGLVAGAAALQPWGDLAAAGGALVGVLLAVRLGRGRADAVPALRLSSAQPRQSFDRGGPAD